MTDKKISYRICPMSFNSREISFPCAELMCAWWDKDKKQCIELLAGKSLYDIANASEDISDTMDDISDELKGIKDLLKDK